MMKFENKIIAVLRKNAWENENSQNFMFYKILYKKKKNESEKKRF